MQQVGLLFSLSSYTCMLTLHTVWELASSMLAIGLSWWFTPLPLNPLSWPDNRRRQALPAVAVGHVIIAIVMVLNGTIGACLHVPFPVLNRFSVFKSDLHRVNNTLFPQILVWVLFQLFQCGLSSCSSHVLVWNTDFHREWVCVSGMFFT